MSSKRSFSRLAASRVRASPAQGLVDLINGALLLGLLVLVRRRRAIP